MSHEEPVYWHYDERKHETEKAVLFIREDEEVWIPKACIDDEDEPAKVVVIAGWWAAKNDFEGDY